METQMQNYDVAVIGGGAAGLSAAQTLGRARRSVIVIDAGQPRNAHAKAMHNFLSRDGYGPLELLKEGRAELVKYGVEIVNRYVFDTRRGEEGFILALDNGTEVSARRLILATGITDQLPAIPGLAEHWGNDVLHCPFCHGWEVKDLRLGVIDSPMAIHQAAMFTGWSKNVTWFKAPGKVVKAEELEQLEALGVKVVEAAVTAVLGEAGAVEAVELSDETQQGIDALVIMPTFDVNLSCVGSLGITAQEHASGLGRYLPVDGRGQSEIPGLWFAGSIANPMAQVIMAAADGVEVGMKVYADLMQEESTRAVAELRARGGEPASASLNVRGGP